MYAYPVDEVAPGGSTRSRWRLLLLTLLVGPALAVADPAPLPPEREAWIRVETAHFTLFSNAKENQARATAENLERFRAVLGSLSPTMKVDSPVPTYIFLFKNEKAFRPYKGEERGYFVGRRYVNYVAVNALPWADPSQHRTNPYVFYPYRDVYHEYVHHFLRNNLSNVPSWFKEGLAEFYGTFWSGRKQAEVGRAYKSHVVLLHHAPWIPLRDLLLLPGPPSPHGYTDWKAIFYAQSWALVHYLLYGNPDRRPQFFEYVNRVEGGAPVDEAFPSAFRTGYAELMDELRDYVGRGAFRHATVELSGLNVDLDSSIAPMKSEDVLFHLGDLLVHALPERAEEAEKHFQRALGRNPSHARAHRGVAVVRDWQKRRHEAGEHYTRSLELDPGDPLTHLLYGWHLLGRIETSETLSGGPGDGLADLLASARASFRKSLELNPDLGGAYLGFGTTYLYEPQYVPGGEASLEKAFRMEPGRMTIPYNLTLLHLKKGEPAKAEGLVSKVLGRYTHGFLTEVIRRSAVLLGEEPESAPPYEDEMEKALDLVLRIAGTLEEPAVKARFEREETGVPLLMNTLQNLRACRQAMKLAERRDYEGAMKILEKVVDGAEDPRLVEIAEKRLSRIREMAPP